MTLDYFQVPPCPTDQWMASMYSLFGTKWCKLHLGPLWNVDSVVQDTTALSCSQSRNIDQVHNGTKIMLSMYMYIGKSEYPWFA